MASLSAADRSLLFLISRAYAGLRGIHRLTRATEHLVEGLALRGLSSRGRAALTRICYERAKPTTRSSLFRWEIDWFERELPAEPCRILVGGAGSGVEVRWLRSRGHQVVAFDPVPPLPTDGTLRLSYEELARIVPYDVPQARRVIDSAPYGAVLLGWGSFTHIQDAPARLGLLRALRQLSDGPVLASFWSAPTSQEPESRARRLGVRLGSLVGNRQIGEVAHTDRVLPHCGYGHGFSAGEVEALAERAGYRAQVWMDGYGRVTFRPRESVDEP